MIKTAIDIGEYSVKIAQTENSSDGNLHMKIGKCNISEINDVDYLDPSKIELISDKINDLVSSTKIKLKNVTLLLADSAVYMRQIKIPKVSETEIKDTVRWQAEKYISFPVEEAVVDYQITDTNVSSNVIQLMLIAARRKIIDNCLQIMDKLGSTAQIIDISGFGALNYYFNLYYNNSAKKNTALLNIGHKSSSVSIVDKNGFQLIKNIAIGGRDFTNLIAETNNISILEAENIKKQINISRDITYTGDNKLAEIYKSIESLLQDLVKAIHRTFIYWESMSFNNKVEDLLLFGGGASFTGIDELLSRQLMVSASVINPFNNIIIDEQKIDSGQLNDLSAYFVPVVGAVL